MTKFGDFAPLCHDTPSYPWCNLFYRQIQHHQPSVLDNVSSNPATAPVGINPTCGIPFVGTNGSLANIANIVACSLSIFVVGALIVITSRRRAAVGRVEFRFFLVLYWLTLPLQLLTTGSFLQQGSTALSVLTAIHAGFVAATFWALLANAIVSTQVVEDGTLSSLIPFSFFTLAFFIAVTYISLDTAFSFTSVFGPSNPIDSLNNIGLFVLTTIWPAVAAIIYFALMVYIILGILNELKPVWFYILAAVLFVLSQLDFFLLNKVICRGANMKIDGSFVATVLETASVVTLFFGWKSITEEQWDDQEYAMYYGR